MLSLHLLLIDHPVMAGRLTILETTAVHGVLFRSFVRKRNSLEFEEDGRSGRVRAKNGLI
jgi:hypothetical protein